MRIFAICTKCGIETEIDQNTEYVECMGCNQLLNTCGNAKLYGVQLSKEREEEVRDKMNNQIKKYRNYKIII